MSQKEQLSPEKQPNAESRSGKSDGKKAAEADGKHSAASQPREAEAKEKKADQEKFRLHCPYCRKRVKAYRRHLGRKVCCPVCQVPFLVRWDEDAGDSTPRPVAVALPPEQRSSPGEDNQPLDTAELESAGPARFRQLAWGAGGVLLVVVAVLVVVALVRLNLSKQFVAEDGSFGWHRQDQSPPPIRDALVLGRQVWRLDGYRLFDTAYGKCLYLVLDNDQLEEIVGVLRLPARQARQFIDEKVAPGWGEVRLWFRIPAGEERKTFPDPQREIQSRWTFRREENGWQLQREEKITARRQITWFQETIRIVIDYEVGEGYWEMDRQVRIKYRGAQAYLGTRVERKQQRGGVFPVLLP